MYSTAIAATQSGIHPWFLAIRLAQLCDATGKCLAALEQAYKEDTLLTDILSENQVPAVAGLWTYLQATLERHCGKMEAIVELLSSSTDCPPTGPMELCIWAECKFLLGFALLRLGDEVKSQLQWGLIGPAPLPAWHHESISVRIRVEKSLVEMNHGEDFKAFLQMQELKKTCSLDTPSYLRLLAVETLSGNEIGRFAEALKASEEAARIIALFPSHLLELSWLRIRASGLLSQGKYYQALQMVEEGLSVGLVDGALRGFLLSLRVEANLFMQNLDMASEALVELETLSHEGVFPVGATSTAVLRWEYMVRSGTDAIFPESIEALAAGDDSKKTGAHAQAILLLARHLANIGRLDEAQEALNKAIALAREKNYLPLLVDMLFHDAGLSYKKLQALAVRNKLTEARDLAKSIGLTTKLECFEAILARLREPVIEPSFRPFVSLLKNGVRSGEIYWLLAQYGFYPSSTRYARETSDGPWIEISEASLWCEWVTSGNLIWLEDENLLLQTGPKKAQVFDFLEAPALQEVLRHFFNHNCKISLPEAHGLFSHVPYHPLRHGERARSLVTRLKRGLAVFSLNVIRHGDHYCLEEPQTPILVKRKHVA